MHREHTRKVLGMMVEEVTRAKGDAPQQLPLPFYGETIDVDGITDPECESITYWGKATCVFDNVYRCYADVNGAMCIVEITVSRKQ